MMLWMRLLTNDNLVLSECVHEFFICLIGRLKPKKEMGLDMASILPNKMMEEEEKDVGRMNE